MESLNSQLSLPSLDSKGRPVGTDRPPPPSPGAPSFAAALARDLDTARRAEEDPGASEEERTGQVEEHVQATIDERAERVATERTNTGDASEEALAERAEEHRSETEPAARERQPSESNDDSRAEAEPSARDHEGRPDATEESTPAENEAATPAPVASAAPVAPEVTAPMSAPVEPPPAPAATSAATVLPATPMSVAGTPIATDPALAALTTPVPATPETAVRTTGAEPGTAATPVAGAASESRSVSMRSVTTVEGRPAPTEADLERADRVLDTVRLRLQPGLRQATLQLQPEELGRVLIRIRLEGSTARAVVRAETSEALAILEKHVPELRAMFEAQGFEGLELDLGLASESHDGGEFSPENWGEPAAETAAETPLDGIELARALNEMDGLDLWA